MEPERTDLTSLSLRGDAFEQRVRAIMRAAAPELARRAERDGVLVVVGQWLRPVLAAAAVVGLLATGALMRGLGDAAPAANGSVVHELGVAEPALQWIDEERAPSVADLEMALIGGTR